MHYVLEHTARDVRDRGGFSAVSDDELHAITQRHVDGYVHEQLNDFQEKSQRFIYLFRRLGKDVFQIVSDMAAELRRSDFEPLDFELDFSKMSDIPACGAWRRRRRNDAHRHCRPCGRLAA